MRVRPPPPAPTFLRKSGELRALRDGGIFGFSLYSLCPRADRASSRRHATRLSRRSHTVDRWPRSDDRPSPSLTTAAHRRARGSGPPCGGSRGESVPGTQPPSGGFPRAPEIADDFSAAVKHERHDRAALLQPVALGLLVLQEPLERGGEGEASSVPVLRCSGI